jgi:PAS domain S-box-containing protein
MVQLDDTLSQSNATINQLKYSLETCQQEIQHLRQAHQQELECRQQIEDELRASQQLLQLVMDTLPEAIFWKDRNSVYLGCNQNFADDAGIPSPKTIIGQSDYDMPWKREEADFYRACDQRVMQSGKSELGIVEPQLNGAGEQTWLETNKAPLRDINGQVIGILGTYQDITRRRQAEIELQELNQRLQRQTDELNATLAELQRSQLYLIQSEKMSALGNLVAGVAHEINNPVGFLSGNLRPAQTYVQDLFGLIDLYQQALPDPGDAIEAEIENIDLTYVRVDLPKLLDSMQEGIKRIRDISTSLRTFSRADTAAPTAYQLHQGLESTLLILKHRLKGNNIRPAIDVIKQYDELPTVECFAGQINQVFMNLLANAIDALDEASQDRSLEDLKANPNTICVTTERDTAADQIHIRIRDNGPGIPVAVQQKMFEEYFTTKDVGQGTGLGLAISHQIVVQKHGGQIQVLSEPGAGTEFIVTLPIYQDQAAEK